MNLTTLPTYWFAKTSFKNLSFHFVLATVTSSTSFSREEKSSLV